MISNVESFLCDSLREYQVFGLQFAPRRVQTGAEKTGYSRKMGKVKLERAIESNTENMSD